MTDRERIREARQDGCLETIEYFWQEYLVRGKDLNENQKKQYRDACAILQCMGVHAAEYADFMLKLI